MADFPLRRGQRRNTKDETSVLAVGNPTPEREIRFSNRAKGWTVAIIGIIFVAFVLRVGEVLPPFIWAAVTAFVFNGLIKLLVQRTNAPRWVWTLVIFLGFFSLVAVAVYFIVPPISREIRQLANDAPKIREEANRYLETHDTINLGLFTLQSDTVKGLIDNVLERLPKLLQELAPSFLTGTLRYGIEFVLYLAATFYLMLMGGAFITSFLNTLPLNARDEMQRLYGRVLRVLNAYIKGQFLLILIMSTAAFIVLSILGVRYSLLLGIMTGILELVPYVGPYAAIAIVSTVAYFQPHGPDKSFGLDGITLAIIIAVTFFIIRQIEDYVVIPAIIGKILELPGLLVIVSITTGAALVGPIGLLLAVPTVAVLKIVLGYLYYKLVDADRIKIFVQPDTNLATVLEQARTTPNQRVLVVLPEDERYQQEHQTELLKLAQAGQAENIDIGFATHEEEVVKYFKQAGFPVVTVPQEHFIRD